MPSHTLKYPIAIMPKHMSEDYTMRLHYSPNTISVVVAIALEEAKLHYDPVLVDFKQAAQTKEPYLSINPKGRVPALDTKGTILTETGALLDYCLLYTSPSPRDS